MQSSSTLHRGIDERDMELNLFLCENQEEEEAHCESTNLFAPSSDLLPGGGRQLSNLQIVYADLQFFCSLIIIKSLLQKR
jgi:hypothetical protein